jgi:hypothetical protein
MIDAMRQVLCAALFCLGLVEPAPAQGVQEDVRDFVSRYVAALNAKDIVRMNALLHPQSRACITLASKDYYDDAMAAQIRDPLPADYRVRAVAARDHEMEGLEPFARFPVAPTLRVEIHYDQGEEHGIVLIYLLQQNGQWFWVDVCATDAGLAQFRAEAPDRQARAARIAALIADIREPLRNELMVLIRDHKTVTAATRYREASGQDAETGMWVVHELTPEALGGR